VLSDSLAMDYHDCQWFRHTVVLDELVFKGIGKGPEEYQIATLFPLERKKREKSRLLKGERRN